MALNYWLHPCVLETKNNKIIKKKKKTPNKGLIAAFKIRSYKKLQIE
jgi:hypothetical protein